MSNIEPCSTVQLDELPTYLVRTSLVHSTESTSKSNEATFAPILKAANENNPLPQPTSKNVLPERSLVLNNLAKEAAAISITLSSMRFENDFQFFPNANLLSGELFPTTIKILLFLLNMSQQI